MQTPPQPPLDHLRRQQQQQQQQQQQIVLWSENSAHGHRDQSSSAAPSAEEDDEEEEAAASRSAFSSFRAKEEQIERKKMEVREKVFAQLGRVEAETKRLSLIQKIEVMADPTRKEVSAIRKRNDAVNKELKPLGRNFRNKEKEYKEALEAFNRKNREKTQLITQLIELVSGSERLRMKKLDELARTLDSVR